MIKTRNFPKKTFGKKGDFSPKNPRGFELIEKQGKGKPPKGYPYPNR